MISKLGQVMLYVNDQDQARDFWVENFGFRVVSEETMDGGFRWIEIAPGQDTVGTSLILHNKEMIAQMSPELNLGTPSLMFFTKTLDALYADLANRNVTVGELVEMPAGKVFNFADAEGNYFAVMEVE